MRYYNLAGLFTCQQSIDFDLPGLWPFWSKSGDDAGDAENGGEGAGDLEAFPAVQGEGLEDVGESLKKVAWKNVAAVHFFGYLEDHPRTCKWLITMVGKSPK